MYKYVHDAESRIVYQYSAQPAVQERTDKRGKRTDWFVTMDVLITRADNKLRNNQWQYATSGNPRQYMGAQYTREQVTSFFMIRHVPPGLEISRADYEIIRAQYEAEAFLK